MDQAWLQLRPHLALLVRSFDAVLRLADEQYSQGRASGDAVDYRAFEEQVARVTAKVEQDVHRIALSGLDVDAPFHTRLGQALPSCASDAEGCGSGYARRKKS